MDDSVYSRLREISWRRKLTRDEAEELRAALAADPELKSDWDREAALNEGLGGLWDVPLSSNFTARVVEAAMADSLSVHRGVLLGWDWRSWLPRAAVVSLVLVLGGLGAYRYFQVNRRVELARQVANVSDVAALSSPEVLQDFETVRHLNQTPAADEELLALLQ